MLTLAIFLDVPDSFKAEASYTIENIFYPFADEVVFVDDSNKLQKFRNKIIYCYEDSRILYDSSISDDVLFLILEKRTLSFFSSFQPYDLTNIEQINGVPCLFPLRSKLFKRRITNIFPFDIVAASFFFLSCWQEYSISARDSKGRIPLTETLQHKLDIIRLPIVNQYLNLLINFLSKLGGERLEPKPMPGGGSVYVALSHDVDHIDWPLSKYIRWLIGCRHSIDWSNHNLLSLFRNLLGKKYIFDAIKYLELKHGAASTYYFLANYFPHKHSLFAKSLIKALDGTSFEVAHHISHQSIFEKTLDKDHRTFRPMVRKLHGARVHTLAFEVGPLFRQLEEQGYLYDNSLLFAENLGYRTGFTYPHYIFDPARKCQFDVVSIPLNVMDGTHFDRMYLSLNDNDAENDLMSFLHSVIPFGGAISILFHNNSFFRNTDSRLRMYGRLLRFFVEQEIRIGTCRELFFWRKGLSIGIT